LSEDEKRALSEDIKEVYAEAKGTGFDPKIMRQIIKIRKIDKEGLDEKESLLAVCKRALGMSPRTQRTDAGSGVAVEPAACLAPLVANEEPQMCACRRPRDAGRGSLDRLWFRSDLGFEHGVTRSGSRRSA